MPQKTFHLPHIKTTMPSQLHNLPTSLDATACTALFTYIIAVFFLVKLSIDELGPEARRRGYIPPSSILYLAIILSWPVTVGAFAFLLVIGLLHTGLGEAYVFGARGGEACCRWITSRLPNRRRVEDLEMGPFVPCHLERVICIDAETDHGCSQAEMAFRAVVATLRKECGLTADKWGRAP